MVGELKALVDVTLQLFNDSTCFPFPIYRQSMPRSILWSTIFISAGWYFIRRNFWERHVVCMVAAVLSSTLFLPITSTSAKNLPAFAAGWQQFISNAGEQNVARQHWKINCCQPAAKAGRFFADVDVIGDIANEKKGGGKDRRDHANDMALPKIPPDKIPAGRNENRAHKIERGIDCR